MSIRKKGNIEIQTNPKGNGFKRTGYTFYSYDKNSAALYFQFKNEDGTPINLDKASIRLLFTFKEDSQKQIMVSGKDVEIISAIRGTARYVLPDLFLRGYTGKVTGYVYLEFEDGTRTDDGKFDFTIKQSAIDDVAPQAGDKYVQDFEDVKERVEQAGDSATKDISSSVSDVQSKASEANEDILNLVKDTEDARYGRNLLAGTSNYTVTGSATHNQLSNETADDLLTLLKELEGQTVTVSVDYKYSGFIAGSSHNRLGWETKIVADTTIHFSAWHYPNNDSGSGRASSTFVVPKNITNIAYSQGYIQFSGSGTGTLSHLKLEKGKVATPWAPAPEDIVTKSELEKIKQAITNLGGSI